jgi:hypothetical protein
MLNLDVHKSIFIHFGTFTISCAMQWMQNFCSTLAAARFPKGTLAHPRMIRTLHNSHFLNFALVDLAKMEFPLGKLLRKVKQIVVSHLPLLLIYFLSSEVSGYRAEPPGEGSGMPPQILLIRALTSP